MSNIQYFTEPDFNAVKHTFTCEISEIILMNTDSYSDLDISKSIEASGKAKELCAAAIQTCIVGYGNKNYGSVKLNGVEINIKKLYDDTGVKTNYDLGSKLESTDLTPRRIQRFYRYFIHEYLEKNKNLTTYLFRKYSTNDLNYRTNVYPMAEHAVKKKKESLYLLHTYLSLDMRLGINLHDRIMRVYLARGLFKQSELLTLVEKFQSDKMFQTDFNKFAELI